MHQFSMKHAMYFGLSQSNQSNLKRFTIKENTFIYNSHYSLIIIKFRETSSTNKTNKIALAPKKAIEMSIQMSSSHKSRSQSPYPMSGSQTLRDSLQKVLSSDLQPLADLNLSKAYAFADLQEKLFLRSSFPTSSDLDPNHPLSRKLGNSQVQNKEQKSSSDSKVLLNNQSKASKGSEDINAQVFNNFDNPDDFLRLQTSTPELTQHMFSRSQSPMLNASSSNRASPYMQYLQLQKDKSPQGPNKDSKDFSLLTQPCTTSREVSADKRPANELPQLQITPNKLPQKDFDKQLFSGKISDSEQHLKTPRETVLQSSPQFQDPILFSAQTFAGPQKSGRRNEDFLTTTIQKKNIFEPGSQAQKLTESINTQQQQKQFEEEYLNMDSRQEQNELPQSQEPTNKTESQNESFTKNQNLPNNGNLSINNNNFISVNNFNSYNYYNQFSSTNINNNNPNNNTTNSTNNTQFQQQQQRRNSNRLQQRQQDQPNSPQIKKRLFEDCILNSNGSQPAEEVKNMILKQHYIQHESSLLQTHSHEHPQEQKEEEEVVKCNCSKSGCVMLYCECFANGRKCGDHCGCSESCKNNHDNDLLRQNLLFRTKQKNPLAFQSKFKITTSGEKTIHARGCNCKKSKCQKKYCECFQAGIECTALCNCNDCCNMNDKSQRDRSREFEKLKTMQDKIVRRKEPKVVMLPKDLIGNIDEYWNQCQEQFVQEKQRLLQMQEEFNKKKQQEEYRIRMVQYQQHQVQEQLRKQREQELKRLEEMAEQEEDITEFQLNLRLNPYESIFTQAKVSYSSDEPAFDFLHNDSSEFFQSQRHQELPLFKIDPQDRQCCQDSCQDYCPSTCETQQQQHELNLKQSNMPMHQNECQEYGQGLSKIVKHSEPLVSHNKRNDQEYREFRAKVQTRGQKQGKTVSLISNAKREKISLQLKYRKKVQQGHEKCQHSRKSSSMSMQSDIQLEKIEPGSVQYKDLCNNSFILKREVA